MLQHWKSDFLKKLGLYAAKYTDTAMPGNFYWKDKERKYVKCNPGILSIFKLTYAEIIGKTDEELWPQQAELFKASDVKVIGNKFSTIIEHSIRIYPNEYKVFLIHKMPWLDGHGNVMGIIGNVTDITNQKQRELDLREEKGLIMSQFEKIIDAVPGNLYWKDKEGKYLGCNNFMVKISNFQSKADIIGKKDKILWPEHEEIIRQNDLKVLQTGKAMSVEENVNERIYLSTKTPLHNEKNEVIGIIGNSVDITYLKEIESELRKTKEIAEMANNAKTEFLENMRHDIRTPLASIIGLAELLDKEANKDKIKKYTTGLVESSKEMLRFLNEILESINVASGEIPLLKRPFNLEEILQNILKFHQLMALEKNLNLVLDFNENIPKNLIGDPIRIYRIMLELVTNSLKFTENGHVIISAKLGKKEGRDVVIQVFVEDTGIGISVEKQQELFVRFKRFTPSYQGIYKGAGLGLSIVKQFIDDLGGEIYVNSRLDKGTTFVCIIPLKEPLLNNNFDNNYSFVRSEVTSQNNKNEANVKRKKVSKKNVLIVEDQSIAALAVKELLVELGCQVDIAENGRIALSQIQIHRYNIIIMDIGLPDMDGYMVTKNIRSFEDQFEYSRTFIIGLTCHADIKKKQFGLDVRMNIVLSKPLTRELAVDLLENIITY